MGRTTHTLPSSAMRSIWAALDPRSREILVEEFLRANPGLSQVGRIDYEWGIEPIFRDSAGFWYSLLGHAVSTEGEIPTVDITQGRVVSSAALPWVWIVAAALIGAAAAQF
ncbi:hypothetical protein ABWI00_06005 [Algihabitans albus]|uniref:hypothetical protein n=1 Tax=Algihabitans albus TaxID=2164067 RepID=UPI0035CF1000